MPKAPRVTPAAFTIEGGTWPTSPLRPDAPVEAEYSRQIVLRLRAAIPDIDTTSERTLAARLGLSKTGLRTLLTGLGVPSATVVSRLEQVLDRDLWPGSPELRARIRDR